MKHNQTTMTEFSTIKLTTLMGCFLLFSHVVGADGLKEMSLSQWPIWLFLFLFVLIVLLVVKVRKTGKNLEKLQAELSHLSRTDDLTELLNRRYLKKRLYEEFEWHMRNQTSNSVLMMVEIDQFDVVTEKFGHAAGDLVVQTVARIIQTRVRNTDLCGRFAAEAFLILLRDTTTDPAQSLADEIRHKVSDTNMFYGQKSNNVTCNIGVAAYTVDMVSCRDWIQQAELALYQAKQVGSNQTVII